MNRRIPVKSLEDLCGERLEKFLTDHCWTVAKIFRGIELDEIVNREENLPLHIDELRNAIFDNIAWYLDEKVVACIVRGVHEAVKTKQAQYTINTRIPLYKTELYCMVTMVDLIVTPRLRRLDMEKLPRILRTHITSRLQKFTGLKSLNLLLLGFGMESRTCGQEDIVAPANIISALRSMSFLTHLVLPNFCTNNIIKALALKCRDTLSMLEIDHSLRVSDKVVDDMLKLTNLSLLSMAGTTLTSESLAQILLGLPKLRFLPNGDFLTDCLEWIAYENRDINPLQKGSLPVFQIHEFRSSEEYHFHSKKQMELVAVMCPKISKMRFFYDSEALCEIRTLEKFTNLRELCLNGGDFAKDPLRELLENIGPQLLSLELNHVENIDRHAIVQMSLCCSHLQHLALSACSFLDYGALHRELLDYYEAGGLDDTEEMELDLLLRDQEVFKDQMESLTQPFVQLKELKIGSVCSNSTLIFLLMLAPGLVRLFIGGRHNISNETLIKIISLNPLTFLEEIEISEGDKLDKSTLDILLSSCSNLRTVRGMQFWKGMTDEERVNVRNHLRKGNIDLDIPELILTDMSAFTLKVELSEETRKFLSTA